MTPNFDPEKAKYTLITNISFVQRDGADRLRLDCHALLVVEEGMGIFGPNYTIRGFGTEAAWEVFQLWLEKDKHFPFTIEPYADTGVGIFRSIKVHWVRRAFRKIGVRKNFDLLLEILKGQVESRTGLAYRGKGLPTIYKKSQSGDIKSLFIIANDAYADVTNGVYKQLDPPFRGTLLYWESEA